MKQGFSLLELSIVLVVIGLIAGGVIVGREVIRTAELNSMLTQIEEYQQGVEAFRFKFQGWPGDLIDAESYWGTNAGCPAYDPGAGTCNGDGNGVIDETFRAFWEHLSLSDLIAEKFDGDVSSSNWDTQAPRLAPIKSYISTAYSTFAKDTNYYDIAVSSDKMNIAELWGIDEKIDDGFPHTGTVIVSDEGDPDTACESETTYPGIATSATSWICQLFIEIR